MQITHCTHTHEIKNPWCRRKSTLVVFLVCINIQWSHTHTRTQACMHRHTHTPPLGQLTLASRAFLMLMRLWIRASPRSIWAIMRSMSCSSLHRSQKTVEYWITCKNNIIVISSSVSWCFEHSQPHRVISGLNIIKNSDHYNTINESNATDFLFFLTKTKLTATW